MDGDVASGVGMWLVDEGDSKGGVKVLGFGVGKNRWAGVYVEERE